MENPDTKPKKENFSVESFLETYDISKSHFYKEVKAGRLKTFKMPGSRLTFVKRIDAETWLELVSVV